MSRPAKPFTDRFDEWLQEASEQEVRDAIASIRIWARWKNLNFTVEVKERKKEAVKDEPAS